MENIKFGLSTDRRLDHRAVERYRPADRPPAARTQAGRLRQHPRSVNSLYIWEGKIHDDEEALLVVKTRSELLQEGLIPAVKAAHPYEVPEIIALPIVAGLEAYLGWIEEVTNLSEK